MQLLGGFGPQWVGVNTPDLAWKGEHGLRALYMDSRLLGQVLSAAATSAELFSELVRGCDAVAGSGEKGTSTSGHKHLYLLQ